MTPIALAHDLQAVEKESESAKEGKEIYKCIHIFVLNFAVKILQKYNVPIAELLQFCYILKI